MVLPHLFQSFRERHWFQGNAECNDLIGLLATRQISKKNGAVPEELDHELSYLLHLDEPVTKEGNIYYCFRSDLNDHRVVRLPTCKAV